WQELCLLMGEKGAGIALKSSPARVMLVGLQGTGKTTSAAKLAKFYKQQGKKVLLVATDLKRPAASEQLQTLAKSIDVEVVMPRPVGDVFSVIDNGLAMGKGQGADLLIIDTAGRVTVDEALMEELSQMKARAQPDEVLLVADAMTGQTAVNVAQSFHQRVGITGVILTKTEGDARGGAILSIRAITGAPVKFIGVGEKLDAFEVFHPDRMASRILGMGDILSLVELAEKSFSSEQSAHTKEKVKTGQFTLEDFRGQLAQIKKMGNLAKVFEMIPGIQEMTKLANPMQMEKELGHAEAMISSMTPLERENPDIINGSRRKRIAAGSGTSVQEINRLLKKFFEAKKMFRSMSVGNGVRGWKNPLRQIFSSM
ncbi:MAG: signal recognition particle protein, partial [Nitrospirae bacterium]|nr:signal recognition particle protein [Candidatus Troglogloeales bacterium]